MDFAVYISKESCVLFDKQTQSFFGIDYHFIDSGKQTVSTQSGQNSYFSILTWKRNLGRKMWINSRTLVVCFWISSIIKPDAYVSSGKTSPHWRIDAALQKKWTNPSQKICRTYGEHDAILFFTLTRCSLFIPDRGLTKNHFGVMETSGSAFFIWI